MPIQNLELKYKCDECKGIFVGREVKLVKPHSNFKVLTPWSIMAVEENGKIIQTDFKNLKEGDRLLACPKCEKIHFNGFDLSK